MGLSQCPTERCLGVSELQGDSKTQVITGVFCQSAIENVENDHEMLAARLDEAC